MKGVFQYKIQNYKRSLIHEKVLSNIAITLYWITCPPKDVTKTLVIFLHSQPVDTRTYISHYICWQQFSDPPPRLFYCLYLSVLVNSQGFEHLSLKNFSLSYRRPPPTKDLEQSQKRPGFCQVFT